MVRIAGFQPGNESSILSGSTKIKIMSIEELNELHKLLRRAKYFYYIEHESLISDSEYDKLEKEYRKQCEIHNIPEEINIYNHIGFSHDIPLSLGFDILYNKKG